MTETESTRRKLYQIADDLLRQIWPRQTGALEFLNDISLLLYALTADQAGFAGLMGSAGQRELTERILDRHRELQQLDYKFGRAVRMMDHDQWHGLTSCVRQLALSKDIQASAAEIFDYLLQNLYDRRDFANFITPRTLADMMTEILEPKSGETVMDPVCGSGRLLISAAKKCRNCIWIGIDTDGQIRTTAFFNLKFHGVTDAKLYQRDFLRESGEECADLILANPPYSDDIYRTIDFVKQIMTMLKTGGRCGILVPEGFLTNVVNHDVIEMRRYLLYSHTLEGVISLPRKIYKPYTVSKSSLILLNKRRASSQHRTFFGCVPEYDGPENEFADTVYGQSMREVAEAWRFWKKEQRDRDESVRDAVFWTASPEEIEEKNFILGADHYRPSEYGYTKPKWEELWNRILADEEELESFVARYFGEDSVI